MKPVVWKFHIPLYAGPYQLSVPSECKVLSLQVQQELLALWCLVDEASPDEDRRVCVVHTGQAVPLGSCPKHLGTVQVTDGYVVHVFGEASF